MGLDMYLIAKKYVSSYSDGDKNNQSLLKEAFPELNKFTGFAYVQYEVGYWRKANHIHKWFVNNVQEDVDDCKEYYVSRDELKTLAAACRIVLFDNQYADKLLPRAEGFFFGSYEIDEWYFKSLQETINIIEKVLELDPSWDIYYQASW